MEEDGEQQFAQNPEFPCSDPDKALQSTSAEPALHESTESRPSFNQNDIVKALEVVERDSVAIADSFSSLFASLRLALSEVPPQTSAEFISFRILVTSSSVDHMQCFSDAAGRLQESVLDAATKGNRYINSCLRLNEEMKGIDNLAAQLKFLKRNVDALDTAVNRLVRPP